MEHAAILKRMEGFVFFFSLPRNVEITDGMLCVGNAGVGEPENGPAEVWEPLMQARLCPRLCPARRSSCAASASFTAQTAPGTKPASGSPLPGSPRPLGAGCGTNHVNLAPLSAAELRRSCSSVIQGWAAELRLGSSPSSADRFKHDLEEKT